MKRSLSTFKISLIIIVGTAMALSYCKIGQTKKLFESINECVRHIRKFKKRSIDRVIIATKSDLEEERIVSIEVQKNEKEKQIKFFETSSKENANATKVFNLITEQVMY